MNYGSFFKRLCHRTVLAALRGAYGFAPAQGQYPLPQSQPVFRMGERQSLERFVIETICQPDPMF